MARILLVEDEPLIAMMLAEWVVELGHDVVGPLHSLSTAVEAADTGKFDAAIIDVNLHRDRSDAVAQCLVARAIPFAFATGDFSDSVVLQLGCPVIAKPYMFDDVSKALDVLLQAPRSGA